MLAGALQAQQATLAGALQAIPRLTAAGRGLPANVQLQCVLYRCIILPCKGKQQ